MGLDSYKAFVIKERLNLSPADTGIIASGGVVGFLVAFVGFALITRLRGRSNPIPLSRNLVALGLFTGGLGFLLFWGGLEIKSSIFSFFALILFVGGFTLLFLSILPFIFLTEREDYLSFWVIFILGFATLGRFFAYPMVFFSNLGTGGESFSSFSIALLVAGIIIFICLAIFIKNTPSASIKKLSFKSPPTPKIGSFKVLLLSLGGLILTNLAEDLNFLSIENISISKYSSVSAYQPSLYVGLMGGGLLASRFITAVKMAPINETIKFLFIILISLAIFLFTITFTPYMEMDFYNSFLVFGANFFIFVLSIILASGQLSHVMMVICAIGLVHVAAILLTYKSAFYIIMVSTAGLYRGILYPAFIVMAFQNFRGQMFSLSLLIGIASFSRFIPQLLHWSFPGAVNSSILFLIVQLLLMIYCFATAYFVYKEAKKVKQNFT
ncbi:MAG: hypothetical protein NZM65_02840 [Flavobacteriales bacterium]|nr:hypothetical protein [Flavobacteriales bacterium]MDW8409607.1 hypothetical protein [Flavobacteriales bacterium]